MKNKIIILLILCLFLCGCGNYRELNQIAIITGIGIDKKDDNYEVSMLIANAGKSETSSKEGESKPTVYSGKGSSLIEATKEVDRKTPKQLYFGHINVVLISEDIAKEGFFNVADWLLRNPESRKKFYLLMTKDKTAKEVLEIVSPLEAFPSQNIGTLMESNEETQAIASSITYSDFINNILTEGLEPVLPSITVAGSSKEGESKANLDKTSPSSYLKLETLAIFKGDKFQDYTNANDSKLINILKNTVKQSVFTINYDKTKVNFNMKNIKSKITIQNNQKFNIKIKGDATLAEINSNTNLNDEKIINNIESKLNNQITKDINNLIKKLQTKYKSDILGLGNMIYKNYPDTWQKIKNNWNDTYFPKAQINIQTDIQLVSTGSLENTIRKEYQK